MKKHATRRAALLFALTCAVSTAGHAAGEAVAGAGSTAAAPIYRAWASAYQKATGASFSYEAVGSSAGIKKIRAGETGFGASDVAPPEAELARDGLVVFPVAITGIVPVVNLPRIADGQLRLTGELLARIFMGEITNWSAPEIRQLNPGVALPDLPIQRVVRGDGSGTTYNFSDYLAKESPAWKQRFGASTLVAWPAGVLPATGSDGVVREVKQRSGAIGYVDFGYVADNGLAGAQVRNEDGEFLRASVLGFRSALSASDWVASGRFTTTLTAQHGKQTWPITMGTFVLVPQVSSQPERTQAALRFFTWSFNHGDALVQQANFVRLPDRVQASAFRVISAVRSKDGRALGLGGF